MVHDFTPRDLDGFRRHGIALKEIERQLRLFREPPPPIRVERPCSLGDGIRRLDESERAECLSAFEAARAAARCIKFVPASGAASRMFASLLEMLQHPFKLERRELERLAASEDAAVAETLRFIDSIEEFAFRDSLDRSIALHAPTPSLEVALQRGEYRLILEHVVTSVGLDLATTPKGLLPFHSQAEGARTPFEEHLVETAAYVADANRHCRVHFTVSPEHQERFESRRDAVLQRYNSRYDVDLHVEFSTQEPSTDTLAVDLVNRPFRTSSGEILLRPGGHGALIGNLDDLQGDLVYIKNIDNVTIEERTRESVLWKKLLGGFLCRTQERIFAHWSRLDGSPGDEHAVESALRFVREELLGDVPESLQEQDAQALRAYLLRWLHRPVRVCGMVRNTGEPGGGPFWVAGADGMRSVQIVERAETDTRSESQQRIFDSGTHFSPVDLVCGVRDAAGTPFDLRRHVDLAAVFITEKSSEGRPLRALEHPGLWNGGMADWITLLVEVPDSTFNPVKTITDLLRPAHQPR
ncbi:MAG: DUF4301 family protein [Candidatus Latescibacterota bacterium]|nr:MAG: DUF4301 family protein [Candidatus Latescibacterota bacterium]